ncbi:baseplate J/gp47 family protein [Pseudomonas sp. dw_358]|uniref:baseplate J/gp47 family protein n=1 Tax=Pseudomonas sp. dw_358 TaxID=2720083 RepID=UPI001BD6C325|nr:baseplate J/gp47 family protein [Pseudomonas sp. dw_358]
MAAVTSSGVTLTTTQEYLASLKASYLDIDSGWKLDSSTPDGMALQVWSETMGNLDEAITAVYNTLDPNSAVGLQIDRIGAINNIPRALATYSTAPLVFSGNANAAVPAGTTARNSLTDTLWASDAAITLGSDGTGAVSATCTTAGAQTANVGEISAIYGSIPAGVTGVTNVTAASVGNDKESDPDYRFRRNVAVANRSNNIIDALYSAIYGVTGVKQVRIYENDTKVTDTNGVLANSLMLIVDGGADADILSAYASVKSPGCGDNTGRTDLNAYKVTGLTATPAGNPVTLTFFRPQLVTIYEALSITSSTLSDTDKQTIQTQTVSYSLNGFGLTTGFIKRGFQIGESVTAGRLYTPANYVVAGSGFINSLYIGTSASSVTLLTIPLAYNQLAVFDADNITITYE